MIREFGGAAYLFPTAIRIANQHGSESGTIHLWPEISGDLCPRKPLAAFELTRPDGGYAGLRTACAV